MAKYNDVMENIKVTDEMRSRILRNVALSLENSSESEKTEEETDSNPAEKKEANITEFPKTKKKFNGAWIPPVALTAAAAMVLIVVRPWSGSSLMKGASESATYEAPMSEETDSLFEDAVAETTEATEDFYDYESFDDVMAEATEAESDSKSEENQGMIFDAKEYSSAAEMSDAVGFEIKDITNIPFEADETIYRVISGKLAEIMYIADDEELTLRKSEGEEDNSGDYNDYSVKQQVKIEGIEVTIKGYEDGFNLATWYDGTYYYSVGSDNPLSDDVISEIVSDIITR